MKLAILGYYGANNAGDDRIQLAIKAGLSQHELSFFHAWGDLKTKRNEIEGHDCLIIGGGGLIIRNANAHCELLEAITIPLVILGISISRNSKDNRKFIGLISRKAIFINVRDQVSADIFKRHSPKCEVLKSFDLTFLIPFQPNDSAVNSQRIGISLRTWHDFKAEQFSYLYHRKNWLRHQLKKVNVNYPILKYWDIKLFESIILQVPGNKIGILMDGEKDRNALNSIKLDAIQNFDPATFSQLEVVIAMRLHTCIFATQMGIPFIALNYMEKVRNYCKEINHEEYCLDLNEMHKLQAAIDSIRGNRQEVIGSLLAKRKDGQNSSRMAFESVIAVIDQLGR